MKRKLNKRPINEKMQGYGLDFSCNGFNANCACICDCGVCTFMGSGSTCKATQEQEYARTQANHSRPSA